MDDFSLCDTLLEEDQGEDEENEMGMNGQHGGAVCYGWECVYEWRKRERLPHTTAALK